MKQIRTAYHASRLYLDAPILKRISLGISRRSRQEHRCSSTWVDEKAKGAIWNKESLVPIRLAKKSRIALVKNVAIKEKVAAAKRSRTVAEPYEKCTINRR